MGSQERPKIPVIDFTKENLKPDTVSWISTCNNIKNALEEYGCFVAIHDLISPELNSSIFSALKEMFDLPTEAKARNVFESDLPYSGYLGPNDLRPLYESLGIKDAASPEAVESFTNVIWPSGNHHFYETMCSYIKTATGFEQMVCRMVFESYEVEKYYESHVESMTYIFRAQKYRVPGINESNVGAASHTDKDFISILYQNQVDGLQVMTKNGEWIEVEFFPSSFLVMEGEGLLAWSNGRVHSALHRVMMTGSETRYSLASFSFHKGIVQVPEELVDDEHPLQFKPFEHFEFLRFYYTKEGQKTHNTAKAYCGV